MNECKYCGRKLKNPISINMGFGNCCGKKNGEIKEKIKMQYLSLERFEKDEH